MRARGRACALGLACAIFAGGAPATAQDRDLAGAEVLFAEGRRMMDAKDYAGACAKFEASQRSAPAVGTLLNLAECFEKRDMIASAWLTFRRAVAEAQRAGRADREKLARERAALLEKRVAKVTIVAPHVDGLVVKRDGSVVEPSLFGTAVPVDAGPHTITASAPNKKPWSTEIAVASDGSATQVTIPALADAPVGADAEQELALAQPPPKEPARAELASGGGVPSQRTIGWIVGGVGLVAAGVGGFFGLSASSKWSDAKEQCRGTLCTPEGVSLRDDATSAATLSTVFVIAGAAAAAAGIVLVLTAPSKKPEAARVHVAPGASRAAAGLTLGGSF